MGEVGREREGEREGERKREKERGGNNQGYIHVLIAAQPSLVTRRIG